jgi:2-keto-4-pentenoate hydratase/2-oxohepta-3-ene-1,7-dioic acid hydratase in catechol pathway
MKIIRFEHKGKSSYGTLDEDIITLVSGELFTGLTETNEKVPLADVKILTPIASPSKIIGLGLNYVKHAKDGGFDIPEEPLLFLKPPSSMIAHLENIVYPGNTERVDYEGELGIVMGKQAKNISEEEALDHVLGCTIMNDVSARDYQRKDGQWARGKGFDTFCPVGPFIVNGLDPDNLNIQTRVNGKIVQDSNTNDLIFNVRHQISFISRVMTLLPGDLISTGTPHGVGPLKKGDVVEVEVEGIGVLKNFVV